MEGDQVHIDEVPVVCVVLVGGRRQYGTQYLGGGRPVVDCCIIFRSADHEQFRTTSRCANLEGDQAHVDGVPPVYVVLEDS